MLFKLLIISLLGLLAIFCVLHGPFKGNNPYWAEKVLINHGVNSDKDETPLWIKQQQLDMMMPRN